MFRKTLAPNRSGMCCPQGCCKTGTKQTKMVNNRGIFHTGHRILGCKDHNHILGDIMNKGHNLLGI